MNKTMLTKLGLISGKVTKDNLPIEFDTWEKIFALGKQRGFWEDQGYNWFGGS